MIDPMTAMAIATAIASAISATVGAVKGKKQAKKDAITPPVTNIPLMDEQQTQLQDLLTQLGGQGAEQFYPRVMGDLYQGFSPIEQQQRQQFMQKQAPGLAEQFTSMDPSAQRSSAFPQALGQSAKDFENVLSQQRESWGQNRLGSQTNFMNLLYNQGLQRQFEPIYEQKAPNPWAQLGGAALKAAPNFLPNKFTGGQ